GPRRRAETGRPRGGRRPHCHGRQLRQRPQDRPTPAFRDPSRKEAGQPVSDVGAGLRRRTMTTLAVRRLLASVTLAVLGAGIGAVGAAGSEPPDATETVSAPDSSTTTTTTLPTTTTTTTIPTTVASTTSTLDRAARRRWAGTRRADVEELVAAISAVGTGSEVAESATVREMFEMAADESARLHGLLDD